MPRLPRRVPAVHRRGGQGRLRGAQDAVEPDLVLTHTRDDLHQDHRLACELTWNTFRDHLILEYEIPKYDGDLGTPNVYVAARRGRRAREARLLVRGISRPRRTSTGSTTETVPRAMRLRGLECRVAERLRGGVLRAGSSSLTGWPAMRVLVTGHHGYIGSVLAPVARRRGPRRRRARHVLLSGLRLRAAPRRAGRDRARRPRRDGRGPRGVRCGRPPRGAVERPARRPQRRAGPTTSTSTGRSRSPARRRRPVSGASSSLRRARCTARRGATTCSTRARRCGR